MVKQIPKTFLSTTENQNSFILPLIEETHADLCSSMKTVFSAPMREIWSVEESKHYKPPKGLFYDVELKRLRDFENDPAGTYEPKSGDLIALTDVRPKCSDDLNRHSRSYLIALVQGRRNKVTGTLPILASHPIKFQQGTQKRNEKRETFFSVFLTNMTTNTRIWNALNSEGNMNIIKKVLQAEPAPPLPASIRRLPGHPTYNPFYYSSGNLLYGNNSPIFPDLTLLFLLFNNFFWVE
ncbi:hypothetical protein L1049_014244 [Liquidambar formosana]|uniref:DUF6469 domain-containing protein n=1 Tax=Liquidambar formosana TaxID=63359 RepID=A0AAP0RLM5_LIQFO